MSDLLDLKIGKKTPVEKVVKVGGVEYNAYFLPMTRREFSVIQKQEFYEDHVIAATWCDAEGNLLVKNADEAGDFPPMAHTQILMAALEVSGFGQKAHEEAKKD